MISVIAGFLAYLVLVLCLPPLTSSRKSNYLLTITRFITGWKESDLFFLPVYWQAVIRHFFYPPLNLFRFKRSFQKSKCFGYSAKNSRSFPIYICDYSDYLHYHYCSTDKICQERKTGYDRNNLAYVFLEGDIPKNYELIKNDLLNSGIAISVNQTMAPLTQSWSSGFSLSWQGKDPNMRISFDRSTTDGSLVKTMGLQFVAGRDIDLKSFPSDSTACVVNESAVKLMKFRNPIGQTIFDDPITWHIVGVIKDFILTSPYDATRPIIFKGPKYGRHVMNIKFNSHHKTAENLASADKIFKKYNPSYPFEYHFIDEEYAKKFNDQQFIATLAALFSGLTIFISCLGLFGLATYMAENRIKEVGVRKILGLPYQVLRPCCPWTFSSWCWLPF